MSQKHSIGDRVRPRSGARTALPASAAPCSRSCPCHSLGFPSPATFPRCPGPPSSPPALAVHPDCRTRLQHLKPPHLFTDDVTENNHIFFWLSTTVLFHGMESLLFNLEAWHHCHCGLVSLKSLATPQVVFGLKKKKEKPSEELS